MLTVFLHGLWVGLGGFNVRLDQRQWSIVDGLGFILKDDPETCHRNFDLPRRGWFPRFGILRGGKELGGYCTHDAWMDGCRFEFSSPLVGPWTISGASSVGVFLSPRRMDFGELFMMNKKKKISIDATNENYGLQIQLAIKIMKLSIQTTKNMLNICVNFTKCP